MENAEESSKTNPLDYLTSRIDKIFEKVNQKGNSFNWKVLTSKEAALALRVTTRTLQNYRDQGIIPFFQFGREVRYHAEDIQLFLMEHYVKPANWKGGLA